MGRVFISYSSQDSRFVDALVQKLGLRSVDVWYAKYEIRLGDSIVEKISEGIGASDWLLLILSKASVQSKWVKQELNSAVALTIKRGSYILPVLIERVDIPAILIDRKYADFVRDPEQAFKDILAVVAPGTSYYDDENSQIAWGILTRIFKGKFSDKHPMNSDTISEIRSAFSGFKEKWAMTDAVYNFYIDCCLEVGRLLNLVEFIERTPTALQANTPLKDDVLKFLLKKALPQTGKEK